MAKNKLSRKFKATPDKEGWSKICPPMEYRVFSGSDAYAMGLVPTGMGEVNSVAVGASGSAADTIMYFANYFRVDGSEIDQEPYIELYESGSKQPSIYGILHHANFSGRTETLGKTELDKIAASGSSTDIQFKAKPENDSGTLKELRDQGKIFGFDYAYMQGTEKKDK
ncbi:MAG: hypothetical protein IPM81_02000 [Saprospirales bacterium]|jgi:hypothetical protein|nr:hypothetical protein [Saprospirales bacterium]